MINERGRLRSQTAKDTWSPSAQMQSAMDRWRRRQNTGDHHNSLVGYLAIQILPSLQISKLQHTVEALILHLENNKGRSFILIG